jgi:ABC-type branched-subunit amino acid transport system substrate-binding protein
MPKPKRLARVVVSLVALVVIAAACGSSNSSNSTTTSTTRSTSSSSASTPSGSGETTGISSNQITLGNISILSGPVPGLFQGAPYGTSAFFAYINSQGGVNGRKLVLSSQDDGFSCSNNESLTQSSITSNFALVGSFSLFDNCGARVLASNPAVPDVSYSLDPHAQVLPNNFSPQPLQQGWRTGPLEYYKAHYPRAIKSVGTLVANVPSSVASWDNEQAAMQSLGYHISYERTINPLETNFTADIIRMRDAGVQMLSMTAVDVKTLARVLNEAQQQGWHPQLIESGGIAYDGSFFKLVNPGAAQGLLNDQQQALYLGQDASTTPEVKLFDTWMQRTHPGFAPDIFSVFAWASARLFVQALQAAGPNPSRSSVLAQLQKITSFDSNGLLAPANPAQKKAPTCWVLIKVDNGRYKRFASPSKGFNCTGGEYVNPHPPVS